MLYDEIFWDLIVKIVKVEFCNTIKKENNPDTIKKELTQSIKREFIVVLYFVFSTIKKGISVHPKKRVFWHDKKENL